MAGSYGGSLLMALGLWGGWSSLVFLAVAVACQTLGWVDALKGSPFSGFTPVTVLAAAGGGLSAAAHAAMLGLLCLLAWPAPGDHPADGSYLVNRLAYRSQPPAPGDWVWLEGLDAVESRAARVVAGGGQEVEWTGERWTVDGRTVDVDSTRVFAGYPSFWRFRVPNGHVLIDSEVPVSPERPGAPWVVIENRRIAGRIWAQRAGFWESRWF